MLLVDPFTAKPNLPPILSNLLGDITVKLAGMYYQQTRYDSAELGKMANSGDYYHRFLITAKRPGKQGSMAITSAGVAATMGFLSRDFRDHDYQLGRHNAYWYLKEHFTLPVTNPLFACWAARTGLDASRYAVAGEAGTEYQIIPLMGRAAIEPPLPQWPKGKINVDDVKAKLADRVYALLCSLEKNGLGALWKEKPQSGFHRAIANIFSNVLWPANRLAADHAAALIWKLIKADLDEWGL